MSAVLQLEDVSWRSRFGCKGPGAETWLAAGGYRVPSQPNTAALDEGVLVARLATSEFLVEAAGEGQERVDSTRRQLESVTRPADVYPVARQDLVIGIDGVATNTLLRQICSVDFAPWLQTSGPATGPIILTSMAGIGVVAWPRRLGTESGLTLWIDPSYAHYFWRTLLEVGRDLGGVSVNSESTSGARE